MAGARNCHKVSSPHPTLNSNHKAPKVAIPTHHAPPPLIRRDQRNPSADENGKCSQPCPVSSRLALPSFLPVRADRKNIVSPGDETGKTRPLSLFLSPALHPHSAHTRAQRRDEYILTDTLTTQTPCTHVRQRAVHACLASPRLASPALPYLPSAASSKHHVRSDSEEPPRPDPAGWTWLACCAGQRAVVNVVGVCPASRQGWFEEVGESKRVESIPRPPSTRHRSGRVR
ncbi:hypothetical protein IWZ00DRAFT_129359 [Phyllosticta capitalensis]